MNQKISNEKNIMYNDEMAPCQRHDIINVFLSLVFKNKLISPSNKTNSALEHFCTAILCTYIY